MNLPIFIVGNGGGYAYGHMGPTHHALEDCAAMNALGVRVLVPAFNEDIQAMLTDWSMPAYLRLGYDVRPIGVETPQYAPWRQLLKGEQGVLAALGPLAGVAWGSLLHVPFCDRPSVWAVTEFNGDTIPSLFWEQLERKCLFVIEEHVQSGGLGMHISFEAVLRGVHFAKFNHRYALGYPTGRYGSQAFHRAQCGLDDVGIRSMIFGDK